MDKPSFRARAHKVFSSLSPLLSSSTDAPSPLWFLPDDGRQKHEFWSPCKDRVDYHQKISFSLSPDYYSATNWKIQETNSKNSHDGWNEIEELMGLDSTLDNEEEEDGFDRMAEGRAFSSSCSALPTASQDAYNDLSTDHVAAQIKVKEDDESLFHVIIKASEDNFQFKYASEGKEDADAAAVMSTNFVLFNLAYSHEFRPASKEDQFLKSILKMKAKGNNHAGGNKSLRQVSLDSLACKREFHGASKQRKNIGDAAVKSRKHVTFDLACEDDDEGAPKKHQGLKSIAERKIRMKKMQRLPELKPQSLSALAQLARLIAEMQQRRIGSSSNLG